MQLLRRLIPKRISMPLILCLIVNCIAYNGGMLLSGCFPLRSWEMPLDDRIPVVPLWAIIYVLSFAYWTINYILICRDHDEMVYRLAGADMLSRVVCLAFFVFLPTTLNQPSLAQFGGEAWLLRLIYSMDRPVNLFPSIHCLVAWLSFRPLLNCRKIKPAYKCFSLCFTLLVFLSTLLTKQHVIVDVFGGWALAELSYDLVVFTPLPRWLHRLNCRLGRETPVSSKIAADK